MKYILIFILLILIAILVSTNIILNSISSQIKKGEVLINNRQLKYGGISPIYMESVQEIPILIFSKPISSITNQNFSLDDICHFTSPETILTTEVTSPETPLPILDINSIINDILKNTIGDITTFRITVNNKSIDGSKRIRIYEKITIGVNKPTEFRLIDLTIDGLNKIDIAFLDKSKNISGTNLLLFVDALARALRSNTIELEDDSAIDLKIQLFGDIIELPFSLYCFSILVYGISWYNRIEYYNIDDNKFQFERTINRTWIDKQYIQFSIDMCDNFKDTFVMIQNIFLKLPQISTIDEELLTILDRIVNGRLRYILENYFNLASVINQCSNNLFDRDLFLLNRENDYYDIQLIITSIFENFLFVISLFDSLINFTTPINTVFKSAHIILKTYNANCDTLSDSDKEKYGLFLILFQNLIKIINAFMIYNTNVTKYDAAKSLHFLYYECFDTGNYLQKKIRY
jgi:hypothetical protein